jgi:CIC family chloride channel protein
MVIGGCAGAAVGTVLHAHWPAVAPHPAAYAVVGMAGFFSAAAKTPFSTVVIVCEMTGGYGLLLPAMWVCVLSYLMSDRRSLYSNQVEGRANSPAHQGAFVRRAVEDLRVGQFLQAASAAPAAPDDGAAADGAAGDGMAAGGDLPARRPPPLRPSDSAEAIIARLSSAGSAGGADAAVLPVVEPAGPDGGEPRLVGVVGLEEVFAATQAASPGDLLVAADLMRTDVVPLRPQDTLDRALELFVEARLPALPVVDSLEDRRLLGVIRRFDISDAYLRRLHGRRSAAADPADPV